MIPNDTIILSKDLFDLSDPLSSFLPIFESKKRETWAKFLIGVTDGFIRKAAIIN